MNQEPQKEIYGTVTGDVLKPYTIGPFLASRLYEKQKKYADKGAILTVSGATSLAPVPVSLKARDAHADIINRHQTIKNKPKVIHRTPKPAEAAKPKRDYNKGIVNVTMNTYYACAADAAFAIGTRPAAVCDQLKGRRPHIKHNHFRYATEAETKMQRVANSVHAAK